MSSDKDLFITHLVVLFLVFPPRQAQIPTQLKPLALPGEELSSPEPLGTPHLPTSRSAHRTPHGLRSRARSPPTHIPGHKGSPVVSPSITSTVWKSVPSMMTRGGLLSPAGRREAGPGEELLSEASDSLAGNPQPWARLPLGSPVWWSQAVVTGSAC